MEKPKMFVGQVAVYILTLKVMGHDIVNHLLHII